MSEEHINVITVPDEALVVSSFPVLWIWSSVFVAI